MHKIGNTGMDDKQDFRYTCYVATANQHLKDFRNSSLCACSHIIDILIGVKIKMMILV